MKLDIFIMDSKTKEKIFDLYFFYSYKIVGSFKKVFTNEEINSSKKKNPYYLVVWDNEIFEEELVCALPLFIQYDFEMVKFYKKEREGYSISPRMFKREILLPEEGLLPLNCETLKMETCLNGWICAI